MPACQAIAATTRSRATRATSLFEAAACTASRRSFAAAGAAEVPPWDLEGRVVVVRKPGLAIVNVYAVNGTAKPYFDETGRVAGDRHQLKRRFQTSVMDLGRELRRDGGVIMAGDWNVSRTAQDTYPRLRTEATACPRESRTERANDRRGLRRHLARAPSGGARLYVVQPPRPRAGCGARRLHPRVGGPRSARSRGRDSRSAAVERPRAGAAGA